MTAKTSTKSVKTAKNSVVTNPTVIKAYSGLANSTRKAETDFILNLADLLASGKTSVRIAKASVKAAIEKSGNAPTFRAGHVESARISAQLLSLKGAETAKVSDILKLADRIRHAYGVEEGITGVANFEGTYADIDAQTPTIAETRAENAETETAKEEKPAKVESVETILRDTLKRIKALGNIRDLKTADLEQLNAAVQALQVIAKNSVSKAA